MAKLRAANVVHPKNARMAKFLADVRTFYFLQICFQFFIFQIIFYIFSSFLIFFLISRIFCIQIFFFKAFFVFKYFFQGIFSRHFFQYFNKFLLARKDCCPICLDNPSTCLAYGRGHLMTIDGNVTNIENCIYTLMSNCKNPTEGGVSGHLKPRKLFNPW